MMHARFDFHFWTTAVWSSEADTNSQDVVYNFSMARGWESKSVEQQIEDARTDPNHSSSLNAAPLEVELRQRREGLLLQRSRILQEIDTARNPRYKELLQEMLRHLESQLD
jgi:hypothetical protein